MRYVFPVLMVLAALLACKGKKGEAPAPSASEAVVAPAASEIAPSDSAAAAPSGSALNEQAAKVPVKEDFEQQAKKTVAKDNLTQQVDTIEKEIKSDTQ
jgi:type III secretory pathway component EscV